MCFAFDAHPPELPADLRPAPMAGGSGAELLELTSGDGTRFSAALASTDAPGRAGVVILPDVRGLYPFYIELTERFAAAGHPAIAIDYFGRSAGLGPRDEDFDHWPHVQQTSVEQIQADTAAALEELRGRGGVSAAVSVGYCFGGMHSFLAGTNGELALDGVVGFYAALDGSRFGIEGPLQRTAEIRGPLLGLFGGADAAIPVETVREFERRLAQARVDHAIQVYPGAPHSFFDRSCEEHAEACADAWRRVLAFCGAVASPAG